MSNLYNSFCQKLWKIILVVEMFASIGVSAAVKMPAVFSDNMVLQRDAPIPVYGTADPGENVTVIFAGQSKKSIADQTGKWKLMLDAMPRSAKPEEMQINGRNSITINNILIGDIWLASGQSNMGVQVREVNNAGEEIMSADFPEIRMFIVIHNLSSFPQNDCEGKWFVCNPENVPSFSAVAYFFIRELYLKYKIPMGIINSSVGSSSCQAWTPREVLVADESLPQPLTIPADKYTDLNTYEVFRESTYNKYTAKDAGIKAESLSWSKPETDITDWKDIRVPGVIESQGMNIDGAVWFRKEVDIPEKWAGKSIRISLGPIRNRDIAFMNGEKIGSTDSGLETWRFRNYEIPGKLVKAGKNVIAVRIFNSIENGGFVDYVAPLKLVLDGENEIILSGTWKCKVEQAFTPGKLPFEVPNFYSVPAGLFNAMIHPFVQFPVKGFIWYQGESNAGNARQHDTLFPAMITSWRKYWSDNQLPFYFVQLAGYDLRNNQPTDPSWAQFRESQLKALALNNTGMAVTIDIGDSINVHPKNKQDVGKRLALWAMRDCYNEKNIEVSGPLYASNSIRKNKIKINFSHTSGGLKAKSGKLKGFAIAGEDKKFVWADAKIDGNSVVVRSSQVKNPRYVRYAWALNPECNLYNGAGLPASPFRTDQ